MRSTVLALSAQHAQVLCFADANECDITRGSVQIEAGTSHTKRACSTAVLSTIEFNTRLRSCIDPVADTWAEYQVYISRARGA